MNFFLTTKAAPDVVPAELVQKINLIGAARAAGARLRSRLPRIQGGAIVTRVSPARARRIEANLRRSERSARANATSVTRNGNTTTYRRELGRVTIGVRSNGPTMRAVGAVRNRLASIRAAGQRVGSRLRNGYASGARGGAVENLRLYRPDFRAARAAGAGVRAGRVWVRNAQVAGGGFWRRLSGS